MVRGRISRQARECREQRSARHRSDDPGGAALCVPAKTADGKREDGGEDATLKEEDKGEHGDAGLAEQAHRQRDEDDDHRHEEQEHPAWLDEHEQPRRGESADGEERLRDREPVSGLGFGQACGFLRIADELRCDGHLGADVAELSDDAEEEFVLFAQGLVLVAGQVGALFGLESHVGVGDFGDGREEEDDSEEEDEAGDAEVGPLHVAEVGIADFLEEDAGREERGDDRADCLEGLGELETELGQSGRTAGSDEWVGGGLEG